MTCWAVIPVKDPAAAKSRLAKALSPGERQSLVEKMALHVVEACRAAANVDRILIVGALPGGSYGVDHLPEPADSSHNRALHAALDHLKHAGASRIVVIAGDLPLVAANEIALLAAAPVDEIAIAPDRHGTGTNAISLPLPAAASFAFAFGRDSFARHHEEAARIGLTIGTIHSQGLACDIDEPVDLADAPPYRDRLG